MKNFSAHLIPGTASIRDALVRINDLPLDRVLFAVEADGQLIGSLTDGDVRRALLRGVELDAPITFAVCRPCRTVPKGEDNVALLARFRRDGRTLVPVIDAGSRVVDVVNFRETKSVLPVDALVMAGGEGLRMRPATEKVPKPLLPLNGEPILHYTLQHLARYGVRNVTISIRYLGHLIEQAIGGGDRYNLAVAYLRETDALGTAGALRQLGHGDHSDVLLMNSDLLTNIDLEDFYCEYKRSGAEMAVATVPYEVSVPYGVFETRENRISSFQEKPVFKFASNAGIYLLPRRLIAQVPAGRPFNATDLIGTLLARNISVLSFRLRGYWLDIGKPADYKRAEEDIPHIHF